METIKVSIKTAQLIKKLHSALWNELGEDGLLLVIGSKEGRVCVYAPNTPTVEPVMEFEPLPIGCIFDSNRGQYIGEAVVKLAIKYGFPLEVPALVDDEYYHELWEDAENYLAKFVPAGHWCGSNEHSNDWGVWPIEEDEERDPEEHEIGQECCERCNKQLEAMRIGLCDECLEEDEEEEEDPKDSRPLYEYYINLDERGEFNADVRMCIDANGNGGDTLLTIEGFDIFEDGYMKHKKDLDGLLKYLVNDLELIPSDSRLVMGN